ncbi:MAG: hypothetical protein WC975_13305 [Phycisphaerae bacterium]
MKTTPIKFPYYLLLCLTNFSGNPSTVIVRLDRTIQNIANINRKGLFPLMETSLVSLLARQRNCTFYIGVANNLIPRGRICTRSCG